MKLLESTSKKKTKTSTTLGAYLALGFTVRQVRRLQKKYAKKGAMGLIH